MNSVGTKRKEEITERWQGHLGGTEIHISVTELLGFWQWLSPDELDGAELGIWV